MESKILISYIIPAYNAEETLTKAVDSIAKGSCTENWEILIVENGSSDKTNQVAEKLEEKFGARVKIFHSKKGVSNARNLGINEAKGKWLAFVDADDYMDAENLQGMYEDAFADKADIYIYGHYSGRKKTFVNDSDDKEYYAKNELEKIKIKMIENPTRYMQVWAKLFKRDIVCKNKIFFNPQLRLSEDSDFTLRYLEYCNSICLSNISVYHYSLSGESTMRKFDGNKVNDYENAMKITGKYISTQNEMLQKAYDKYILMHLNIAFVREVFCIQNKEKYVKKIGSMKQIARRKIFHDAICTVHIKESLNPRLLPIFLMKHNLYYLSSVVYLLRAYQNHSHEKNSQRKL